MAVDSRAKGARGEYLVRDMLRDATGLKYERVPCSGALSYLKGDLYVPHANNRFCIEVKNYEESPLSDKVFTNKSNYLVKWWEKIIEQAEGGGQEPLLIFKYNRSQVYVVTQSEPESTEKYMFISWLGCYVMLLKEWLEEEEIQWLKPGTS
jgi:Holliday junction resolvase